MIELGCVAELHDSRHETPKYVEVGYPMVRVTDICRGYLKTKNSVCVDEETYEKFSNKHKPRIGDILFSRVGSYGNSSFVGRYEEFCLGQNTVCISPNRDRIDPFFLYCCLNSDLIAHQVSALVGGASQGTISLKNIKTLQIPSSIAPNATAYRRHPVGLTTICCKTTSGALRFWKRWSARFTASGLSISVSPGTKKFRSSIPRSGRFRKGGR